MRFKLIFILITLLFISNTLLADDAQISHVGGNIIPIRNDNISMELEDLQIKENSGWDIDVLYRFKNNGKKQIVKMGFPESWGQVNEISKFQTWINGKLINSEKLENQDQFADNPKDELFYEEYRKIGGNYLRFYSFDVFFKENETVEVRHRFKMGINCGPGEGGHCWFSFILKTGSLWKGPIKKFRANLETTSYLPDDAVIYPGNAKIGDYQITWEIDNFEPKNDLVVDLTFAEIYFEAVWYSDYINQKDEIYLKKNKHNELSSFYSRVIDYVLLKSKETSGFPPRFGENIPNPNSFIVADALEKTQRVLYGENSYGQYNQITFLKALLAIYRGCCVEEIEKMNKEQLISEIKRCKQIMGILNKQDPLEEYSAVFDMSDCKSFRDLLNYVSSVRKTQKLSPKILMSWYSGDKATELVSAAVLTNMGYGNTTTAKVLFNYLESSNVCTEIIPELIDRDREHSIMFLLEEYGKGSQNKQKMMIKAASLIRSHNGCCEPVDHEIEKKYNKQLDEIIEKGRRESNTKEYTYANSDIICDNQTFLDLMRRDMFDDSEIVRKKIAETYAWKSYQAHDTSTVQGFDKTRHIKEYFKLGREAILREKNNDIKKKYIHGYVDLARETYMEFKPPYNHVELKPLIDEIESFVRDLETNKTLNEDEKILFYNLVKFN